ncbi:MAG: sulfatase-like hydrolase/transferase, partial [Verrucomicrobiae bacterium]|nr:sulfatase-like hydrolase/transferase [Verrucomicrobiae bacterium]
MKKILFLFAFGCSLFSAVNSTAADKPNILWIVSEDNSLYINCFGDKLAKTPNIDGLAADGVRYKMAYSNAAVCAPARTTLILGMYPPSVGGEHMRSQVPLPGFIKSYAKYLQEAGYYTTNNSKKDYNLDQDFPGWDESSNNAHWKNRPAGKPFFAIFNTSDTHESRLHPSRHTFPLGADPAAVHVPAYLPDTPTVRNRIATYYHCISVMDDFVGEKLKELEDAGLAEDTIVFY